MLIDSVIKQVSLLIRSGYKFITMLSTEEGRSIDILEQVCKITDRKLYIWSMTSGWEYDGTNIDVDTEGYMTGADGETAKKMKFPVNALDEIMDHCRDRKLILVLKDITGYYNEPKIVRKLKDLIDAGRKWTIVSITTSADLPELITKDAGMVEVPLPDRNELKRLLEKKIKGAIKTKAKLAGQIVQNSLGLTRKQANHVFNMAIANDYKFTEDDLEVVAEQKRQIIAKTGVLEFYRAGETMASVGGLDNLKQWLEIRKEAFSERARVYGLPQPKGLMLLGVQGCGKSLVAKAVSDHWKIPLLRLDVGALFNSYMGKTEANIRLALRMAESIAPAVLWIDEIEKGFAGIESSGRTDGGTTARMFGTFLTWMQEKKHPVFVVATANRLGGMPPELLRKGRFDEIFFVDLPTADERQEIFDIHLRKRQRKPGDFDLRSLIDHSAGFSGAEIEQAIIAAMYAAFPDDREFKTEDILKAMGETVPIAQTMPEEIQALRSWADTRARWATTQSDS